VERIEADYLRNVAAVRFWNVTGMHLVGEDVLAQIGLLARLQVLIVGGFAIADTGMSHLAGLTDLKLLAIYDSEISSAGLARLARLTKLNLQGTRVTDAVIKALQNALTRLRIHR
jgi:hypothetical protein